jgi:hypothetical protein
MGAGAGVLTGVAGTAAGFWLVHPATISAETRKTSTIKERTFISEIMV